MALLNLLTTVSIGLMTGTEFAVSVFINPILWSLDEQAQAKTIRLFAKRLGTAMPFWYVLNLLLLLSVLATRWHSSGRVLLLGAIAIWAVVILLTILFLVPINNRMARLQEDAISSLARNEHRQWDTFHRLRIAALVAAMVCFLLA